MKFYTPIKLCELHFLFVQQKTISYIRTSILSIKGLDEFSRSGGIGRRA